ncbi:MAG: lipid-A-disaccharide synthase, partial [Candidatus Kryptoniota bacterium]
MNRTLMIIAGETSGDKHAAKVVESLKSLDGNLRIIGIGGDEMERSGVELIHHIREMAVMGFSEVITRFPFFRQVKRDLIDAIKKENPAAVILVDYPGFNLRFARTAKKLGLKVIYYISPQIWAWGMRRIKDIRRNVDLMLTIFKFEEELYKRFSVEAHFVGHPLMDMWYSEDGQQVDKNAFGVTGNEKLIALLPGSRLQEVKRVLPVMLRTASIVKNDKNG